MKCARCHKKEGTCLLDFKETGEVYVCEDCYAIFKSLVDKFLKVFLAGMPFIAGRASFVESKVPWYLKFLMKLMRIKLPQNPHDVEINLKSPLFRKVIKVDELEVGR